MNKRKSMRKGYVTVYAPEHPMAHGGFVYEHFIVAEAILGRLLRDNEHVHHLDFNPTNNRPENLLILDHGQHTRLHNFMRRHDVEGVFKEIGDNEYHVKECLYCDDYIVSYYAEKFCDKECKKNYMDNKKASRPSKMALNMLLKTRNKVEVSKIFGVHRSTINSWLWS